MRPRQAAGWHAAADPWQAASWLREAGLEVVTVGEEEAEDADEYLCADCGRWWLSRGALAQHRIERILMWSCLKLPVLLQLAQCALRVASISTLASESAAT